MPNPMDAAVVDPEATPEPQAPVVSAPSDPFSLDETRLASLSPEQRAALDPVFEEWKTKAKAELEKTGKTYEEKYKPHMEKAEALDALVKDQRFQAWWRNTQQAAAQGNPQAQAAIDGSKPQDFATAEEWQNAISEAYSGNPQKMQAIQARMFAAMAAPVVQQLRQGQEELKATLEMKDLFERHADAKELDAIGRDPANPNDTSKSLLEFALDWADNNNRPLEEGYALARKWADSLRVGAKQEAMGLVQSKKQSVTSGPSTNQGGAPVVEVENVDELMRLNMEYLADGKKPPRFVIKPKAEAGPRWVQTT